MGKEKKSVNKKREIEKLREKELSVPMKKVVNHQVERPKNNSNEISVIYPVKTK